MKDEDFLNFLNNSGLNEQDKYRIFKKRLVDYCNKQRAVIDIFRILKGIEIELKNCMNGKNTVNVEKATIEKLLRVIRVELQIIRFKMKHPDLEKETNEKFPIGHWTDAKVDLVELIYAISLVNSVDGGKASIKTIKEGFEYVFGIKLGNIHDRIDELSIRKEPRVRYLERLINSLNKFLDNLTD